MSIGLKKKGAPNNGNTKFVGMDVHKDAITIAVMNSAGKVIMESIIETKAVTILQFIQRLRGESHRDCLTYGPSAVGASGVISADLPACRIFDGFNQSILYT